MATTMEAVTTSSAPEDTTMAAVSPVGTDEVPAVVLTLALISGCAILALLVAKLADYIYDKHVEETSNSAISNRAKKMLTTRGVVMALKTEPTERPLRVAKSAARKWIRKASKTSSIVTINELNDNDKVQMDAEGNPIPVVANGANGSAAWADKVPMNPDTLVECEGQTRDLEKKDLSGTRPLEENDGDWSVPGSVTGEDTAAANPVIRLSVATPSLPNPPPPNPSLSNPKPPAHVARLTPLPPPGNKNKK